MNFSGYPAQVWATCWQSMAWLSSFMASGATDAFQLESPVSATFYTLWNGLYSLDAWQAGAALSLERQNLLAVQALPLSLDPTTQSYFQNRIASLSAAASGLAALPSTANPFNVSVALAAGNPAIAAPGAIE